jgi:hypothetical protein
MSDNKALSQNKAPRLMLSFLQSPEEARHGIRVWFRM